MTYLVYNNDILLLHNTTLHIHASSNTGIVSTLNRQQSTITSLVLTKWKKKARLFYYSSVAPSWQFPKSTASWWGSCEPLWNPDPASRSWSREASWRSGSLAATWENTFSTPDKMVSRHTGFKSDFHCRLFTVIRLFYSDVCVCHFSSPGLKKLLWVYWEAWHCRRHLQTFWDFLQHPETEVGLSVCLVYEFLAQQENVWII